MADAPYQPLAARMRPVRLEEYIGQQHILAPGKPLREAIDAGHLHSMIMWGPPGVGKTTLARLMAGASDARFISISAVLSGVKEIRAAIDEAQLHKKLGEKTVLFVDEVHRFNKSQQDAFLPYVEDGTVLFIGATTENPSFELNNALLSRARVYVLRSLEEDDLLTLLQQALRDEKRGFGKLGLKSSEAALRQIARAADGDARRALNILEIAADLAEEGQISDTVIAESLLGNARRFDKQGEYFYDQISALHKSVRGSDPDGALYWLARMIDGGCDPLYVARRVVRMASEDIGNADPRALPLCLNAWDVQERLGSPEGELAIAQAVAYLAVAPKSNAVYKAWNAIKKCVQETGTLEVPLHLRNAPTKLMKEQGYGAEYHYAHDFPDAYVAGESYLPDALANERFYEPVTRGLEIKIGDKLSLQREKDNASPWQRIQRKRVKP
ncbi:MAG: replication-associated recombination protein A [Moraxellaceae bacterium]|nr:replication-associated recombination protein A [Moraxellaceae bacterium]MBP7229743.1 replication-associated recombination protein A [Moraxellaceae bacterium]MBP8852427.1 replication-associated recombination protein A [Moraxellaceae bacterium]MBP9045149.1 replication-associated recombination protein A [Moraxellaceae bacterium]MBP9730206.1 replication-associated recombination protein A [Moraxellaceae bacterium]